MIGKKGFLPFLGIAFFNSFIDLGHKILIQNTIYQTSTGHYYTILSAIVNALILIPYILLFTPSGFIADKFAKASVLRWTAAAAIPLAVIITVCYYQGWFWSAFVMTLLLAIQSVINSPAKYGYIKEAFGVEHIAQANAFVQTVVIVAILAGTFAFTLLFSYFMHRAGIDNDQYTHAQVLRAFAPSGFLLIFLTCCETFLTWRVPKKPAADPASNYHLSNYWRAQYLRQYLSGIRDQRVVWVCIMGLSVFWAVNQVLLATYGAYLKEHVHDVGVVFAQGSLAIGGLGVLVGALYAGKISKGCIETRMIPWAVIGIVLGLFLMPFLHDKFIISVLFFIYGIFGGLLIVPLNALIQFHTDNARLGKVLAANNFMQNVFMLSFLVATVALAIAGTGSILNLRILFIVSVLTGVYGWLRAQS